MTTKQLLQSALQHHRSGHMVEAEALYQKILQAEPDHADALHLLGALKHQEGKNEKAVELIGQAIRINPRNSLFHYNLGTVFQALSRNDKAAACYQKTLTLKPDYVKAHLNLGHALRKQGLLDEAIASYHKAITLKPDYAEAHYNLGVTFWKKNQPKEAAASFRKAILIQPDYAEALNGLGVQFQAQGHFEESIACYRKAVFVRPDYAEAQCNLGYSLRCVGKLDEAVASLHQALLAKPEYADAHANLAAVYIDMGRFDDAQIALANASKSQPDHLNACALLTATRKMTLNDSDWLNVASGLLSDPHLPMAQRIILLFALGKYYDDTEQYALAFSAYQQANELQRKADGGFDRNKFSRFVDAVIATYNADFMDRGLERASSSRLPVLIVGMPRSGTSLIEQIIASHPAAFGAGELAFWEEQFMKNQTSMVTGNYGEAFVADTAAAYEQYLRQYSTEALRITDKMPGNFPWLGMIHLLFPQARIIHARRNPVDTCLSIYFQNLSPAHSFATDLDDLAFYYREYDRLMRHWREVLPADRFLEVPYEALINNQADWSRRIIEFIGLEWDERCLDFHQTERKVGTSSNWQVRQKIYLSSKARWRNYEQHLGPLLGLLELN